MWEDFYRCLHDFFINVQNKTSNDNDKIEFWPHRDWLITIMIMINSLF